jgi:hypothetical protein
LYTVIRERLDLGKESRQFTGGYPQMGQMGYPGMMGGVPQTGFPGMTGGYPGMMGGYPHTTHPGMMGGYPGVPHTMGGYPYHHHHHHHHGGYPHTGYQQMPGATQMGGYSQMPGTTQMGGYPQTGMQSYGKRSNK